MGRMPCTSARKPPSCGTVGPVRVRVPGLEVAVGETHSPCSPGRLPALLQGYDGSRRKRLPSWSRGWTSRPLSTKTCLTTGTATRRKSPPQRAPGAVTRESH